MPPTNRGKKIGLNLGKSYLEYAPLLGYRGSVFNLVYKSKSRLRAGWVSWAAVLTEADNLASLRIWDQLGFQRVGEIPKAGRLRTADGSGEEYVDAVVIHKSFV